MSPATDIVVLSSSPERNAICPPPQPVRDEGNGSLNDGLPSPLVSPPEPARPPTRSRYFAPPKFNQPATKDRTTEDARTAKQTVTESDVGNKPKRTRARKPQNGPQADACDLEQAVLENNENAATKPKRTRKKPADSGSGGEKLKNKTITGKVTKSGTAKSKKATAKSVDCDIASKPAREESAGKRDKDSCEEGLQLEPAVKRRLDWTPTKEPAKSIIELEDKDGVEGTQNSLSTLLFDYGYDGAATVPDRAQVLADNGPTKRRRIELVDSRVLPAKPKPLGDDDSHNSEGDPNASATSKSSKPSKKPKTRAKRLTTLTARVTASYHETSTDCSDSTGQAVSVAAESSAADKPESRKTKKKADENSGFKTPRRIVLSPQDALDSLDQQDLVFGTCSQLEREGSPTLLRDTQAALQESEKESSCALPSRSNQCPGPARSSSAISRFAAPRNLWSAAARDTEESLVDVEVVDLVDSPEASKVAAPPAHDKIEKVDQTRDASESSHSSDVSRTDDLALDNAPVNKEPPASTAQIVEKQLTRNKPKQMPNYNGKTDVQLAQAIQKYGLKAIKNRKKMIEVLEKCWVAQYGPVTQEGHHELQSKETTTTKSTATAKSQPSKIQERPAKPQESSQKKPKTQPQSQPSTSRQREETNETTITTNESKQTPTKPKSQQSSLPTHSVQTECASQPPQKRSFADVEEIQDSEDELLPSPSRIFDELFSNIRQKEASKKQELPTSTIPSSPSRPSRKAKDTQTIGLASASSNPKLPDLGEQITKAVRAQPRQSQSPVEARKRPSWHEKILMYDPIYLEDFTRWLNTEGFNLVDEDREIGAGFVREWCEKKGICCCYKVKKNAGHS